MPTLPQVTSGSLILRLETKDGIIDSLSDGTAVTTWTDASGNGYNFSRGSGASFLTKQTVSGLPYIHLNGTDDWLLGPNAIDNPTSISIFAVTILRDEPFNWSFVLSKIDSNFDSAGWAYTGQGNEFFIGADGISQYNYIFKQQPLVGYLFGQLVVWTMEMVNTTSDLVIYQDGVVDGNLPDNQTPYSSASNSEPLRIGRDGQSADGFSPLELFAILVYEGAPNSTDRDAIIAWLTARYTPVVGPTPNALSLTITPGSVESGVGVATVTIDSAAPVGGTVVTLSSSNTSVATVPATVTVSAGQTTANFNVTDIANIIAGSTTITAASGTGTATTRFNVRAPRPVFTVTVGGVDRTSYLVRFVRNVKLCQPGADLQLVFNSSLPLPNTWDAVVLYEGDGTLTFTGYVMTVKKVLQDNEHRVELDCADTWIRAARAWQTTNLRESNGESLKTWISTLLGEAGLTVTYTETNDPTVPQYTPIPIASYADIVTDLTKIGAWFIRTKPTGVIEIGRFGTGSAVDLSRGFETYEYRLDDSSYRNEGLVYGIGVVGKYKVANRFAGPDRITVLSVSVDDQSNVDYLARTLQTTFDYPKTVTKTQRIGIPSLQIGTKATCNVIDVASTTEVTSITSSLSPDGYSQEITMGELCPKFFGYALNSGSNPWIPPITTGSLPVPPPCTPVMWHNHVIIAYANHIWETFDFGGPCSTATWDDITGNILGTITDFQVMTDGTTVAVSGFPGHPYGGTVWKRIGNTSLWGSSIFTGDLAAYSGAWSFTWFNEDGTGTHGLAYWGGARISFGCAYNGIGGDCLHWTYQSSDYFTGLIGSRLTFYATNGTVVSGCSQLLNGSYAVDVIDGAPRPLDCGTGDGNNPNIWQSGFGILLSPAFQAHFSPYGNETFHYFNNRANLAGAPDHFFDGATAPSPFTSFMGVPFHYTDDVGVIWAWTDGNLYSSSDGGVSWSSHLAYRFFTRFSLNVAPGSQVRRIVGRDGFGFGTDYLWKSTNSGTTWIRHPNNYSLNNIYTAPGEVNRLYAFDSTGNLWISPDEFVTATEKLVQTDTVIGIWVDTRS